MSSHAADLSSRRADAGGDVMQELHHVAIPVRDAERTTRFYADVVGLTIHPTKPNWMIVPSGRGAVHYIVVADFVPSEDPMPFAPHIALRVPSLEATRDRLLAAGVVPYQLGLDGASREIPDDTEPLDWGIGTLFVVDPDGHAIEFVQAGRGIFAAHVRD